MELQPREQALELLRHSRTPLISIPEQPSTDAMAAALALRLVLEKMQQQVKIVSPNFTLPPTHAFLPKSQTIEPTISSLRDFIISIDVSRTKLGALSYNLEGDRLNIHLKPKQGSYSPQDIQSSNGTFAHDLIIVLDAPSLEDLGKVYDDNTEFFQAVPIINIDHHSGNTRFGQVKWVDVVANAVSELVFDLTQALGPTQMDEQVATTLLAGIMSKTKAFQSRSVTPRALATASQLVAAGAHRDEIIRNLYQTKTLATLKVWGQALTKLQTNTDKSIVWTTVTNNDIRSSGASIEETLGVLDELMVNAPAAKYYLLLIERGQEVEVAINHPIDQAPTNLPTELQPVSTEQIRGRLKGTLESVSQQVVKLLEPTTPAVG